MEASQSRPPPQRIIGSKPGYYKVSYALLLSSNGANVSRPPEWVPKHQVPQDLVLTWRNQRSERMAFVQNFMLKKPEGDQHAKQTIPSSSTPQKNLSASRSPHPHSPSTPRSRAENVPPSVSQTSPSHASLVNSENLGVGIQPWTAETASPKAAPAGTTVEKDKIEAAQPDKETQPSNMSSMPETAENSFATAAAVVPTNPAMHAPVESALDTDPGLTSQGAVSTSNEPVELRDEVSASQTPKRGGVFKAVRDAAQAAFGVFSMSQSEPASSLTDGSLEKDTAESMNIQTPAVSSAPHAISESNSHVHASSTTEDVPVPSATQHATVSEGAESVSQNNEVLPEAANDTNPSHVEQDVRANEDEKHVSRSGRRIRRPVSANAESSNEMVEALNSKITQQAEEIKFLKALYEEASNSATKTTEELGKCKDQIRLLKKQLSSGIEAQRNLSLSEVTQWKQEAERVTHQLRFLEQREHQLNDDIRRKAAEWDKHVEQEQQDKQFREKRWKEWDQRKQKEGLVFHAASEIPEQDSLSHELAELAAEASEASNMEPEATTNVRLRSSRRRAAAAAQAQEGPGSQPSSDAAISTADNPEAPGRAPAASLEQSATTIQNNQPTNGTPVKRPYEAINDATQLRQNPLPLPDALEKMLGPYQVTSTIPPSPWNLMATYHSTPNAPASVPRWKRRRQESGSQP